MKLKWYQKDKYGYPIELIQGRSRFSNIMRIILQNIRKITG